MSAKIKGRFCERPLTAKSKIAKGSFRWVHRGKNWILVGCPKGKWNRKSARCKVGTRGVKLLAASRGRVCCPKGRPGEKCIRK